MCLFIGDSHQQSVLPFWTDYLRKNTFVQEPWQVHPLKLTEDNHLQ